MYAKYQTKLIQKVTVLSRILAALTWLLGTFCYYAAPAQAEPARDIVLQWEKLMGAEKEDRGICAQSTDDGGYIIAGETQSYYMWGHGGYDYYLAKLDSAGRMEWRKTIGNLKDNRVVSVTQTADKGYIIIGSTEAPFARKDHDAYLVKTDAAGKMQWQRTYGGTGEDTGTSAQQTADGGCIITGKTSSFGAGDTDVYLIKTSATGLKLWQKAFGGKEADAGVSVRQTTDGGYIIAGETFSSVTGDYNIYLIKTDPNGNQVWAKTFGGLNWDTATDVLQTEDEGYIVLGQTFSSQTGQDIYLIKTNANGEKQWEKTLGGANWDVGKSVKPTSAGGYMIAGWTDPNGYGQNDFYMAETDPAGTTIWENTLENDNFDSRFSIQPAGEDAYIITGWWEELLKNQEVKNDGCQIYTAVVRVEQP